MTRTEVIEKVILDCHYRKEDVEQMSDKELFEAYLNSEAIYGYSSEILEVIEAIYKVELTGE